MKPDNELSCIVTFHKGGMPIRAEHIPFDAQTHRRFDVGELQDDKRIVTGFIIALSTITHPKPTPTSAILKEVIHNYLSDDIPMRDVERLSALAAQLEESGD